MDMSTPELQRLQVAWLSAKEAGDQQTQLKLLREHPEEQAALVDFIAGFYATETLELEENAALLPLTQRAYQSALARVLGTEAAYASLGELRKSLQMSKVDVAKGLRLTVDVWNKLENGAIEAMSMSRTQLERLAQFFQIGAEQFATLLNGSQPSVTINRRQTKDAARNKQQGPGKQSFAEALDRSTMSPVDKQYWSGEESK
jgi:transcriptional regulator with XRE-family HTH domain